MTKYKDEEYRGYTINVYYDPSPESPREWSQVAKLVSFDRNIVLDEHKYKSMEHLLASLCYEFCPKLLETLEAQDDVIYDGSDYYMEDNARQEITEALEDYVKIMPISCYSHSGTTIWVGHPRCKWDSGYIGVAFQTKEDTIRECATNEKFWKEVAEKSIECEVEEMDMYIRGEVFGFVVEDEDGDEIDSCWGFFGDDGIEEAISEAKGSVDHEIRRRIMGDEKRCPMLFTYEEMCGL